MKLRNLLLPAFVLLTVGLLLIPSSVSHRALAGPGDDKETREIGELGADWWQWATSIPLTPDHPVIAGDCNVGQEGEIFFLAGTFGNPLEEPVLRLCEIPAGKCIFLPALNTVWIKEFPKDNAKNLRENANADMDAATIAKVIVDGEPVEVIRADSRAFRLEVDNSWLGVAEPGTTKFAPSIADGYWVLIKDLAVGPHVIEICGQIGDGFPDGFETSVVYFVEIVENGD